MLTGSNRFTAATVAEIAYGHTVTSLDDEYIHLADRTASETVEAGRYASFFGTDEVHFIDLVIHSPGSMLVDFFPICGSTFCLSFFSNS